MTVTNQESVIPEFAHAVRGYDRYQVDDYIERLHEWALAAHHRAQDAERREQAHAEEVQDLRARIDELQDHGGAPDRALREAAEGAAAAFGAALEEAEALRRRANADAEQRVTEAAREATAIVESARQAVAGLTEQTAQQRREARSQTEAALAGAAAEADEVRRRAADEAAEIRRRGAEEHDRLVAAAEAEAEAIRRRSAQEQSEARDAVERLQAERAEIVGELTRLRGAIQTLISVGQDGPPARPGTETTEAMDGSGGELGSGPAEGTEGPAGDPGAGDPGAGAQSAGARVAGEAGAGEAALPGA